MPQTMDEYFNAVAKREVEELEEHKKKIITLYDARIKEAKEMINNPHTHASYTFFDLRCYLTASAESIDYWNNWHYKHDGITEEEWNRRRYGTIGMVNSYNCSSQVLTELGCSK